MFIMLIQDYFKFGGILLHHLIADLFLERGDRSFSTYGLIGSGLLLCFVSNPYFKVIAGGVLLVTAADVLPYVFSLHHAFFCCGMDWSRKRK